MLSLGYGAGAPGVAASDDHEAAAGAASASMLLGGGRLPQLRLARRGLIRSPFFSVYDSGNSRIVCPPNADGLQKRNRAELCLANLATFAGSSALYTGKVSSLSNRQGCLKKLLQLVAEFYRETRLRPLLSRQAGLAERMRSSAAVSSAIKSTRIAAAELDSEIKRLQNSSTDQLLGRLAAEGPSGGAGLINFDAVLSDLEGQRPSTGIVQLTARSLRLAYANVLRPGIDSSAWKRAEDARLIALVDELGERNWGAVSAALSSSQGKVRPPLACAQRWLSRHRRSRIQEQQLPAPAEASSETVAAASVVSAVNESIATQATGRIDWRQVSMQLKLYPKSHRAASELWRSLAPDLGYDWPASDRLRLLMAVDQFGPFRFFRIAQYVGTRTDLACRKAVDHLLTRDQPPWSYADDRRLFLLVPQPTSLQDLVKRNIAQGHSQKSIRLAVQKFIDLQVYNICWTDLLSMFPGRSAPGLAWRWRQLVLSSLVWERVKASVGVGDDTRRLLLRTPLMAKLLASGGFLDCNSGGSGGDQQQQQVAATLKQEPTAASKEELSQLLMDADEGFLLPRPLPGKVTNSRFKLEKLRRDATAKAALWRPIVSALTQSVNRQNFDEATRLRLRELLLPESEDRLWLTLQTAMEAPQLKTRFDRCKTVRQYRAMVPQIVQSILSLASSPSKQSSGAATNAAHPDVALTSTAAPKEPPPTLPASLKSAQAAKKRRLTAATASATFEGDESTRPKKRHRPDPAVEPNRVSEFFRVYLADTDAPPMPLNMSTASAFRRLLSSRERLLR
uniref:Reverse transcriptase domain-containing protein n=1 Tax=Macrostomum lignano TaxID=282301 RepID=A0A1I8ILG4_9PLAT